MMDRVSDRALFLWLFILGWVGVLAGIPYTLALIQDPAFASALDSKNVWLNVVFEAMVQLAPASAVGVWLGRRVGLGPRIPQSLAHKKLLEQMGAIVGMPLLIGLGLALPVLIAELAMADRIYRFDLSILHPVVWVLRSFSAAITEEIAFRLGLMTLFVWVLRSVVRRRGFDETALWLGNLLSALLFGAAHLPGAGEMVTSTLVFNTLAGLLMGWLYQTRGLLAAMVAHFVADAVRVIPLL